ncbi:cilia- and flagella-associated protein 418 isoform X2 [Ambystoma mexicanum]|uniref:cilia- and flagella-associated protein 418 isoform X2 n=1 Tax=Ambystoma mexicanum TaxID=8296 RepID=UPI0037E7B126
MADDLDQLLDEVESRFCRTNEASNTDTNPRRAPKARSQPNRTSNASVAASKHDDIDGLIQDLFEDVNFDEELVTPKIKTSHQSFAKCSHMQSKKCCPVYLGGSSAPSGLGTTSSQRLDYCIFVSNWITSILEKEHSPGFLMTLLNPHRSVVSYIVKILRKLLSIWSWCVLILEILDCPP